MKNNFCIANDIKNVEANLKNILTETIMSPLCGLFNESLILDYLLPYYRRYAAKMGIMVKPCNGEIMVGRYGTPHTLGIGAA